MTAPTRSGAAARSPAEMHMPTNEVRVAFDAMASRNEIVVDGLAPAAARPAIVAAIDEVRRIEAKYSRYRADSVLSRINASAGSEYGVEVDAETAGLLDFAASLFEASGGRFDVTSGPLRRAWDFRAGIVPDAATLAPLLAAIGWRHVERDGARVRLARPGMELDFGGIGKEYAADRARAVLARAGVRHGFVNLAGDLSLVGPRADGGAWSLGIQHPRAHDDPARSATRLQDARAATCASVHLASGALATSGDYERFFVTPEGRRCCHILDPRDGQPVTHWQSVSVVAPTCAAAGALATIAMLLGPDALAFLRAQGIAFFAVDRDGAFHACDIDVPFRSTKAHP